jgi:hypothetical protein
VHTQKKENDTQSPRSALLLLSKPIHPHIKRLIAYEFSQPDLISSNAVSDNVVTVLDGGGELGLRSRKGVGDGGTIG